MPKPLLQKSDTALDRDVATLSETDPRTVRRVRKSLPVRYKNKLAILEAVAELGLTHLFGAELHDPDADPELDR